METFLTIIQIIISVLLVVCILSQSKSVGLNEAMSGGTVYSTPKKGAEKVIFNATIVLAILFVAISVVNLLF